MQMGRTALHLAAIYDHHTLIPKLLEAGAQVDATNNHGGTALHAACHGAKINAARELLKGGASVQAKNDRNKTPVEMAREEDVEDSHKEIFELLLDGDEVQEALASPASGVI
jgi:ankyrin repeat protein